MSALEFVKKLCRIRPVRAKPEEPDDRPGADTASRPSVKQTSRDETGSLSYVPKRGDDWGTVRRPSPKK